MFVSQDSGLIDRSAPAQQNLAVRWRDVAALFSVFPLTVFPFFLLVVWVGS